MCNFVLKKCRQTLNTENFFNFDTKFFQFLTRFSRVCRFVFSKMSFHTAISQTLSFGQLLGLMPISGIKSDESRLKRNVLSVQFFHFLLVLFGVFLFVIAVFALIFHQQNYSLGTFIILVVYSSNFLTLILFYRLGKNWKNLMMSWSATTKSLPQPKDTNFLRQQLNLRLYIVASTALSKLSLKLLTFWDNWKLFSRVHFTNFEDIISSDAMWTDTTGESFLHANVSINVLLSPLQSRYWFCC